MFLTRGRHKGRHREPPQETHHCALCSLILADIISQSTFYIAAHRMLHALPRPLSNWFFLAGSLLACLILDPLPHVRKCVRFLEYSITRKLVAICSDDSWDFISASFVVVACCLMDAAESSWMRLSVAPVGILLIRLSL